MNPTCEQHMASISARADGEEPEVAVEVTDAHLTSCVRCRRFSTEIGSIGRPSRVSPAPQMPDLSRQVAKRTALADRMASIGVARGVLALIAVQVVVLSVPDLLAVDTDAGPAHAARHLGAFSIAYAAGLIVVVVRPARARTMFHVACVLGVALVLTAIVDVAQGRVPLIGEATHLPELLSVWLLWLLARPPPEPTTQRPDSGAVPLRSVPDPRGDPEE